MKNFKEAHRSQEAPENQQAHGNRQAPENQALLLEAVAQACDVLRKGGTILYPTDTVWGLGCDACNPAAVDKISRIKNRPDAKSYIILMADEYMLSNYVEAIPPVAYQLLELADKPLTIIYPSAGEALRQGNALPPEGTVAIRIPKHPFCQSLIRRLRRPIISTSANLSGMKAPATYTQIDPALSAKVDWTAPSALEIGSTGHPSSIIKLGMGGEVEVIR